MAVPQRPAPRQRRRQAPSVRKAQILRAARHCFAREGFKATTVDHIAAEAGVSVGLLYRIFGSKTAIIEAIILEQVEAQIAQAFEIISATKKSSIDRAMVLKSFEDESLDLQKLALTFEIAAEACRNQKLRAFMQRRRAELYAAVVDRLKEGGMDAKTAERMLGELDLLGAIASGAVIQSLSNPKRSVLQNIEAVFQALDGGARKRRPG